MVKTATIKGLNNNEQETTNESISGISGEIIQNVQTNFDVCSSLIVDKDKYKGWHNFVLKIFFSKYINLKLRTKKDYLKIIKNFIEYFPDLNPED